jgi:beta-glucosidase
MHGGGPPTGGPVHPITHHPHPAFRHAHDRNQPDPLETRRSGTSPSTPGRRSNRTQWTWLAATAQARDEGVDIRGYLHWSAFDNFEWAEGYRPKFGLIAVDRVNGFTRTPKPSAHALARVAATGHLAALREPHQQTPGLVTGR